MIVTCIGGDRPPVAALLQQELIQMLTDLAALNRGDLP